MIIVDTALEQREQEGSPIRVGLVGAGYMGRGITAQMLRMRGMRLAGVANRTLAGAERAYREAGAEPLTVGTSAELEDAIAAGTCAVTDDPTVLTGAPSIDVIIECTGEVEFGAHVASAAIAAGKHVVLMNAELDATIGPILKVHADRAGVVLTDTDGDEPGVAMNLLRYVRAIGYEPVLAGNIKGFIDRYRTPETQAEFAARVNQQPPMITSFADGTKLSMEATILANAAGFGVARRGMEGRACTHVKEMLDVFSVEQLLQGGLVDYALGAEPGTGAFVVGYADDPVRAPYMSYFKMGDGPLYLFYLPWHLPNFDVPLTAARAVLFNDAAVTPLGAPRCDVVAVAKRDLSAGETLDGIGGFTCYGTIENAAASLAGELLPMGLSAGCVVKRDVEKDEALGYADVELPDGRLADALRAEQVAHFAGATQPA